MKFFIPHAESASQAESVYQSIAVQVAAPMPARRIYSVSWNHQGQKITGRIDEPLPTYYQTGSEEVLAIFDCGSLYNGSM